MIRVRPVARFGELGLLVWVALLVVTGFVAVVGSNTTELTADALIVPIAFGGVAMILHLFLVAVGFRGESGTFPGVPVKELSADQKEQLQKTVKMVFEPYRHADQEEVRECLDKQGGLDACSLAFYAEGDMGDDEVWDNWRLEGPSFVFYFRGSPHVHMWINIGSDPSVPLNA